MRARLRVLIAGGGIGGLTAALALLHSGIDVEVYEQARELKEVGAGVQLAANGTRVLYALGVGEELKALSCEAEGKEIRHGRTWRDVEAFRPRPGVDRALRLSLPDGLPADLLDVLARAVRRAKPDTIRFDARCTGFAQDESGVALKTGRGSVRGDVLIGADGVHSTVRQALFGADRPEFTGVIAWRSIVPIERLLPHGAPGRLELGRTRRPHRSLSAARLEAHELDTPYRWALMVRPPLERWSVGRATLLGDAAHSMLPFLAQGAVQAIEDGYVLARCLRDSDDPETALQRYERARKERTRRTVEGSAANIQRFHNPLLADPEEGRRFIDREWATQRVADRYEWLFSYDATAVPV